MGTHAFSRRNTPVFLVSADPLAIEVKGTASAGLAADSTWTDRNAPDLAACFTSDVQIATINGKRRAEDIKVGDLILTVDNGYQPVLWVSKKTISADELRETPDFRPVRIRQNSIAKGLPEHDLLVSPQHRILVKRAVANIEFDSDEALVAAKHLLTLDGVENDANVTSVTYVQIACARHEMVFAEGLPTETMFTEEQSRKSTSAPVRGEISTLVPDWAEADSRCSDMPAWPKVVAGQISQSEKPRLLIKAMDIDPRASENDHLALLG